MNQDKPPMAVAQFVLEGPSADGDAMRVRLADAGITLYDQQYGFVFPGSEEPLKMWYFVIAERAAVQAVLDRSPGWRLSYDGAG